MPSLPTRRRGSNASSLLTILACGLLAISNAEASLPGASNSGGAESAVPAPSVPELKTLGTKSFDPAPKGSATEIVFQNGIRFESSSGEPILPERLRVDSRAMEEGRISLLVQVEAPCRAEWIRTLEAAGARVQFYVPNYAFLVRVDAADRAAIERLPFVTWTGAYHPAYRISGQSAMQLRSGVGEYQVLLFDDGDLNSVITRIEAQGGEVDDFSDNGINKIVRFSLDRTRMEQLAAHPDVQWIEPRDRFVTMNSNAQWVDMTNVSNNRKVWDQGIDGTGQIVMVGDSGITTAHNQFRDNAVTITTFGDYPTHRKVIAYVKSVESGDILFGDAAGASYHGTHTSCTIAGDDSPHAADLRDGLAKGAKIYFIDSGGSTNGIITPGDLNDYFQPAYTGNAGGAARVSTNSWGSETAGAYTATSMATDQFANAHKDFLISFSNGNAGGAGTVGSPASAKNILSSGGTQNGASANLIYSSTSRGPTDDGRQKPTVCSPGQAVSSANGSGTTGYASLSGTSMASPNLAGSATLVRQYFTDGWYPTGAPVAANEFTPSAALLRAMMINSAIDDFGAFNVPDNNIGWGRILSDNVLFFPGDTRRTVVLDENDGVATGEAREYEIFVSDTSQDLKVTLVWTDMPSTPAAAINLVNDLDLEVDEGANTYLGNVWSGGQSTTGGTKDSRNVEECVRRATPVAGTYTIRVEGANVPFGPQPYAIVVSGGIGGSAGVVTLDSGSYGAGANVAVRVEDTNGGASVTVSLESSTETTPETFVIAGTGGVYEGSYPLSLVSPLNGDAKLSVSDGDQITVTYDDASPSHASVATASVSTTTPVITAVSASPSDISAVVTWTTNVATSSQVEYGTTAGLGTFSGTDPALVTSHSILLEGLAANTTYFFDPISADHAGNAVRDDLGGSHYRFTTGSKADVLLVIGDDTVIDEAKYASALNATGWTYNVWRKAQAANPAVGDSNTGMRSYKAVWWQVGWEQYPPFESTQRDALTALHDGGARIAFVSHDVAWAFSVANSGFYSLVKRDWFNNTMHATYQADPTTFSQVVGIASDPISGSYTGGLSYTPFRSGAAGDEINTFPGTGTATYVWRNNDVTADDISVKWVNGVNNGTPGVGVWGGTPTRTASMFVEWTRINAASNQDAARNDILDKTVRWLIGGDHPDAAIVSPNGGEVLTTSPVSVSWTSATDVANGRNPASTKLEYSTDGGLSWTLITSSPGTSPYSWNVTGIPASVLVQVRATVTDDGTPVLSGSDASNANFALALPGSETIGPLVVAGSPNINPNPVVKPNPVTLTATISDLYAGGSNVTAAEWSAGAAPAAPGSGTAMTGGFGAVEAAVSALIDSNTLPSGATSLWIRGRDSAGNWGGAHEYAIQVNGGATGVEIADGPVTQFSVDQNSPNPFIGGTRIRFALPEPKPVSVKVYNVEGRLVRTLADAPFAAGRHTLDWDGFDMKGRRVTSGVYFYKVAAGSFEAEKKMVVLK